MVAISQIMQMEESKGLKSTQEAIDQTTDGSKSEGLIGISFYKTCYRFKKPPPESDQLPVLFFDLDNTLYSQDTGIAEQMGKQIQLYFQEILKLPAEESAELGRRYYRDYGLAIKGLVKDWHVDPHHYDQFVDGGLLLEEALTPNSLLNEMLEELGKKARMWVFTNAGLQHALRVIRLQGIESHFEAIAYCDYGEPDFPAKPDRLAYQRAMELAGQTRPELCYFVDDSANNVRTANEFGWNAVHLDERGDHSWSTDGSEIKRITSIYDLIETFKEL